MRTQQEWVLEKSKLALVDRQTRALERIADALEALVDVPQVRVGVEAAPQSDPEWVAERTRRLQRLFS